MDDVIEHSIQRRSWENSTCRGFYIESSRRVSPKLCFSNQEWSGFWWIAIRILPPEWKIQTQIRWSNSDNHDAWDWVWTLNNTNVKRQCERGNAIYMSKTVILRSDYYLCLYAGWGVAVVFLFCSLYVKIFTLWGFKPVFVNWNQSALWFKKNPYKKKLIRRG